MSQLLHQNVKCVFLSTVYFDNLIILEATWGFTKSEPFRFSADGWSWKKTYLLIETLQLSKTVYV